MVTIGSLNFLFVCPTSNASSSITPQSNTSRSIRSCKKPLTALCSSSSARHLYRSKYFKRKSIISRLWSFKKDHTSDLIYFIPPLTHLPIQDHLHFPYYWVFCKAYKYVFRLIFFPLRLLVSVNFSIVSKWMCWDKKQLLEVNQPKNI